MAKATKVVEETQSEDIQLSPAEIEAIKQARAQTAGEAKVGVGELAKALIEAINATKEPKKKTIANRKKGDPWQNPDGSPKPKLRRQIFHHGVEVDAGQVSSGDIELMNKLKPGLYCDGHVRVIQRRDKSLDVDYPIRTAAQRLKLGNSFGIRSWTELLQRLIDERANPVKYRRPEDEDDD